ncbi:MAG: alpha/beta fold hydrolase [Cyclobacteriaceae bacterium]
MHSKLTPSYKRPSFLFNGHIETIYPALVRKVSEVPHILRERISTSDGDFLDLDWMKAGSEKLLILQHGLEGSSTRAYMLGMAKLFHNNGYDVCAWNFRGCSGEPNLKPIFYHSGATYDLDTVVQRAAQAYEDITLIGFSLGGNLTLKYLGEQARNEKIKRAIVISTPLDLSSSASNLDTPKCFLYRKRFLKNLINKVKTKDSILPGTMPLKNLSLVKDITSFDEYFTAPLHGFDGAEDYYKKNSSKSFLEGIKTPTLILNALNDPLLTSETLNPNLANSSKYVKYEITPQGGHVGYAEFSKDGHYWSERRALDFCESH